jgi:hypothetical protein
VDVKLLEADTETHSRPSPGVLQQQLHHFMVFGKD